MIRYNQKGGYIAKRYTLLFALLDCEGEIIAYLQL